MTLGERFARGGSRKDTSSRYSVVVLLIVPLLAVLFQLYVPRFAKTLEFLELPLLITVYFALLRGDEIFGLFYGAGVGLVEDSMSHQPLGLLGIVKTLVGYFAASASHQFNAESPAIRFLLGFFFCFFHKFLHWVMLRALLGQPGDFDVQGTLIVGLLNAIVCPPLFHVLDKLKERA
jgi:rod shape-determining protein MreD